ncbi:hypothetical protein [Actinocatenispora thailandica]|uniref:hypothetical protein n=1 Tax=Actinocatenispora thailandica TaxID=227318 RepID=UPI00194E2035|nr:hypothetical protein [Actinocatenispora thailandica]
MPVRARVGERTGEEQDAGAARHQDHQRDHGQRTEQARVAQPVSPRLGRAVVQHGGQLVQLTGVRQVVRRTGVARSGRPAVVEPFAPVDRLATD